MKPIDHVLWPYISRLWIYVSTIFLMWVSVLPLVGLSLLLPPVPAVVMLVVGVVGIVTLVFLLVDSRNRFVQWRRWSMRDHY